MFPFQTFQFIACKCETKRKARRTNFCSCRKCSKSSKKITRDARQPKATSSKQTVAGEKGGSPDRQFFFFPRRPHHVADLKLRQLSPHRDARLRDPEVNEQKLGSALIVCKHNSILSGYRYNRDTSLVISD